MTHIETTEPERSFMPTFCHRCGESLANVWFTMSRFNTQMICGYCAVLEERHPRYTEACDEEFKAVRNGDYNYPGIGAPDDLLAASAAARAVRREKER